MSDFDKNLFIPFAKVDAAKREVSGIVTAERPDKDHEVCSYEQSKPYYKAWSDEFKKATDGASLGNLREMHGLKAVGKALDLDFNDSEKEIVMTFKIIDDEAWRKVDERVYTGFSQGGRKVGDQVPDPIYKGCMRYVANPSEISLVDNPCLPDAHFAYVKTTGEVEMRKFLKTEVPSDPRVTALEKEVTLLKAARTIDQDIHDATARQPYTHTPDKSDLGKDKKTKRVAGEDLGPGAFAYVGSADDPSTWKLPIKFSTEAKTASHIRNALARFNQTQGIPSGEKDKVLGRIKAAARKHGIDVSDEKDKMAAIGSVMRKAIRAYVNRNYEKIVSPRLLGLDSDLGKMAKGMREISQLACALEDMQCLLYCVHFEQECEGDEDSPLPEMLAENISAIAETLVAMVNEETREMVDAAKIRSQVA